jgi:Kef-type K+ transport system membrane component KefB
VTEGAQGKSALGRAIDAVSLAAVFTILWAGVHFAPGLRADAALVGSIGFLLLAGTLMAELLEVVGLPHISGFLLAGALAGPHLLGLIPRETVPRLSPVNTLALALIALAGGGELRVADLRKVLRSLTISTLAHSVLGTLLTGAIFIALRPFLPFARELPLPAALGASLLVGVVAVARSPSATLGVISQTHASGPLSSFTLAFVMISNVVVVALMAVAVTLVRPLIDADGSVSIKTFETLGRDILGSVSIGTSMGLLVAAYLRLVGRRPVVVLVALGFGGTEVLRYLHFDPLLAFLVAGFVVQNLSGQGAKFLGAISAMGEIVYVLFFAIAGASLNIPLLREQWGFALIFVAWRALVIGGISVGASRLAGDAPNVRAWGWSGLVAQAGLSIGLAGTIAREFPSLEQMRDLVVAVVAINQVLGPILLKVALDRTKESRGQADSLDDEIAPQSVR